MGRQHPVRLRPMQKCVVPSAADSTAPRVARSSLMSCRVGLVARLSRPGASHNSNCDSRLRKPTSKPGTLGRMRTKAADCENRNGRQDTARRPVRRTKSIGGASVDEEPAGRPVPKRSLHFDSNATKSAPSKFAEDDSIGTLRQTTSSFCASLLRNSYTCAVVAVQPLF